MSYWAQINIWPEELIELQREIMQHPQLQLLLANHNAIEWEAKIAEIALYCEVILDGEYLPEQMIKLCEILRMKLVERRKDNRQLLIVQNLDSITPTSFDTKH